MMEPEGEYTNYYKGLKAGEVDDAMMKAYDKAMDGFADVNPGFSIQNMSLMFYLSWIEGKRHRYLRRIMNQYNRGIIKPTMGDWFTDTHKEYAFDVEDIDTYYEPTSSTT